MIELALKSLVKLGYQVEPNQISLMKMKDELFVLNIIGRSAFGEPFLLDIARQRIIPVSLEKPYLVLVNDYLHYANNEFEPEALLINLSDSKSMMKAKRAFHLDHQEMLSYREKGAIQFRGMNSSLWTLKLKLAQFPLESTIQMNWTGSNALFMPYVSSRHEQCVDIYQRALMLDCLDSPFYGIAEF